MTAARMAAGHRLAARLMTCTRGLRYVGIVRDVKRLQRRLAFLRRMGVHAQRRLA